MEFFQDLFFTASIALILSFVVAKLVSFAVAAADAAPGSGLKTSMSEDEEELLENMVPGERLTVPFVPGESRVRFIDETTEFVDEFKPTPVVPQQEDVDRLDQIAEECCGLSENLSGKDLGEQLFEYIHGEGSTENMSGEEEEAHTDALVEEIEVRTERVNDDVAEFEEHGGNEEMEKGLLSDEDDWEGIERSELEQVFDAAAKFVGDGEESDSRLGRAGSDVQMELYGLHKVATQGPCHEPQPMLLMVSARAKWNAWQRLGNMNPDMAMEQYIEILSDKVPGWMEDDSFKLVSSKPGMDDAPKPNSSTYPQCEPNFTNEMNTEMLSFTEGGDLTGGSNSVDRVKE